MHSSNQYNPKNKKGKQQCRAQHHYFFFRGEALLWLLLMATVAVTIFSLRSHECLSSSSDHPISSFHNDAVTKNRAANDNLESSLLFLFHSLPPPDWKTDQDVITGQHLNMKTIANAIQRRRIVDPEDITLVTHGSMDKFPRLVLDQVEHWQGPISLTIYLDRPDKIQSFCQQIEALSSSSASDDVALFQEWVSIHVLLEKHEIKTVADKNNFDRLPYPNNVLRNIAQRNIESNYFLLLDVDFITSPGLYHYLKSNLGLQEQDSLQLQDDAADAMAAASPHFWTKLRNNTVFVIPAFERFPISNETPVVTVDMVPHTQAELAQMIADNHASRFHAYYCPGHSPTNYSKWFEEDAAISALPPPTNANTDDFSYPIDYKNKFEPYVVAYKHGLPEFWDGFRGFGFNAATWFWELHLAGYRFQVVRRHFVVHLNHPGRAERVVNKTKDNLAGFQLRRFMRYVARKYHQGTYDVRRWKRGRNQAGQPLQVSCE